MRIDREIWLRVQPHFITALSMEPAARQTWIADMDTREPAIAPVLRRLIDNHDKAIRNAELATMPRLLQNQPTSSPFFEGQIIGPFRLIGLLGRGGMGEVWRAAQTGGHVEREIALKLPLNIAHGTATAARFQRERRILASLSHPNIARLIDAGVSKVEGGGEQPWMAMDLVAGEPLHQHLSSRKTNCETRIRLFRQILAAVAHAHRHLIVHRDLKPANILVDAEGTVKLLDFGIAKLIDETDSTQQTELTQVGTRALTLRYAAPEQVTGGVISTTTDVWALGLILYEVLTGQPAYRTVREGRPFTELAITAEEIKLPSSLKAGTALDNMPAGISRDVLTGDLDAIVLKALRKVPTQRYPSVEAFDADLAAYLENRPVSAREGNRRYLLGRYFARHRVLLGAGAAVFMALAVGLGVAETQRRQLVAEKARAAAHFANVRGMANSMIFEIHDGIENLPGATDAKKLLLEQAEKYLSVLARESAQDSDLKRELAAAYLRLGNIRGQRYAQNVGDHAGALVDYDHALELLPRKPETIDANNVASEDLIVALLRRRSNVLDELNRTEEGMAVAREGMERAKLIADRPEATPEQRLNYATMLIEIGNRTRGPGQEKQRMVFFDEALAVMQSVKARMPASAPAALQERVNADIAWHSSNVGHTLRHHADAESKRAAIEHFERALKIHTAFLQQNPLDASRQRSAAAMRNFIGLTQSQLGDHDAAYTNVSAAVESIESLALADRTNAQAAKDAASTMSMAAGVALKARRAEDAIRLGARARAHYASLPEKMAQLQNVKVGRIGLSLTMSEAHLAQVPFASSGSRDRHVADARAAHRDAQILLAEIGQDTKVAPTIKLELARAERIGAQLATNSGTR
jgi:serine/threonine protein kinase